MPVSGFKKGERVLTPAGRTGTVVSVRHDGKEWVTVAYDERFRGTKEFSANALRSGDRR